MKTIRAIGNNPELITRRREQIVLCAMDLFVKEGYDNSSMLKLAGALGWSKPTLYSYVGSKQDIVFLIQEYTRDTHDRRFREMDRRADTMDPIHALRDSIRIYIEGVDGMQNAYNFLNHVVVSLDKEDRKRMFSTFDVMRKRFERLLRNGIERGQFCMDNPALVAQNIILIGTAWAHWRWSLRKMVSLHEYIELQTQCILEGILPRHGQGIP